jgi:nitrite reductase/ring-hydroxylating ferredoxin subunit
LTSMGREPIVRSMGLATAERADSGSRRPRKYVVARVEDVPSGSRLIVDLDGKSVGIFNLEGQLYALLNHCPHKGAELCRGEVVGTVTSTRPGQIDYDPSHLYLSCPWHGWEYDLATGQSWWNPARSRVRTYEAEVEAGEGVGKEVANDTLGCPAPDSAEVSTIRTDRFKGPFKASTFPIHIEDDYIVVYMSKRSIPT